MRYLGIINGVVFRIDSTIDTAGRAVGLVSLETDAAAASKGVAAAPTKRRAAVHAGPSLSAGASSRVAETSATPSGAEETVHEAQAGKAESIVHLFPRDGAEPLRPGHPDLWNLLVAGTCLEGTTFRST
jgi:hypothetical protein